MPEGTFPPPSRQPQSGRPQPAPQTNSAAWSDALLAVELLAVDRAGLGGACLRAPAGTVRETWLRALAASVPLIRRMPASVDDQALMGGLDLGAMLQRGRALKTTGLLESAIGGILIAAMAERMPPGLAARLGMALDASVDLAIVALDEGIDPDEACPPALLHRLAFHLDLTSLSYRDTASAPPDPSRPISGRIAGAQACLAATEIGAEFVEALCGTALALGIASLRAPLLAIRTARAAAALDARLNVSVDDAALAVRLVLAPRATRVPETAAPEPPDQDGAETLPDSEPPNGPEQQKERSETTDELREADAATSDLLLEAARAAIPLGLLARMQAQNFRGKQTSQGQQGARQTGTGRGRPVGTRIAPPGRGLRLNLIETLRAAAPWQPLRTRQATEAHITTPTQIQLRREDFRVTRTEQRSRSTTIFVVDASGSSALNRLAEAKGAVELLLADCYQRRDQVAVIAFRGRDAQILLPPTRSLVRAKRSLASLPGGGGTPLAAGIDAGFLLAETTRRAGATPALVLLTDGRANVTRAGTGGRAIAAAEANQAARRLRTSRIRCLVLDISPRPAAEASQLAQAMGALYVPLPYANAAAVTGAVRAAART